MIAILHVQQAGPQLSVQDLGRAGHIGVGLSTGGAMDRMALLEGAALLGLSHASSAIEMVGMGGRFNSTAPLRIALTGAQMSATIDGAPVRWNASHTLLAGQVLAIGGAAQGTYGYLSIAGGIAQEPWLGSVAAHFSAGIGAVLAAGDKLPIGSDPNPDYPQRCFTPDARLSGGTLRIMTGPQTDMFDPETLERFTQTSFRRSTQANRVGSKLDFEGADFRAASPRSPVSDFVTCGDVQMTGDGVPFILLAECQTIGGYPRIGTIIDADRPRAAQLQAGAEVRFEWISAQDAENLYQTDAQILAQLRSKVQPLVRNPADIPDLLSYQLISGATSGDDLEQDT